MGVEWLVPSSRDEQRGSQAGQWALPGGHTTMYYTYHHTTMYYMLYHYHHTTIYHLTLLSHYHVLHVPSHYPVLHVLHCQNHYHVLHLTLPSHYQNHHNALHIMASHSHHHPLHTAHQIHITLSASTSTKRDRQSVHSTKSLHVFKCSLRTTLHRRSLHKAQCAAQSLSDTAMAWS